MTKVSQRKAELEELLQRDPKIETSAAVDHMESRFPDVERHAHRAMFYRIRKQVQAQASKPGRKRKEWPRIGLAQTLDRRNMMVALVHTGALDSDEILARCARAYPDADEGATRAMLSNVRRAEKAVQRTHPDGDYSQYDLLDAANARANKRIDAECPKCGERAIGEDEVQRLFGYRCAYSQRQSNCRECRRKKG